LKAAGRGRAITRRPHRERKPIAFADRVADGAGRVDPVQAHPLVGVANVEGSAFVEFLGNAFQRARNDVGRLEVFSV
jgi:hypothetical protein